MFVQRYKRLGIFLLCMLPWLTSCEEPEEDYYPFVERIEVSAGKGYVEVTIHGMVRAIDDFIVEVQIIKFRDEIIVIPIAQPSPLKESAPALDPFQKNVRVEGLEKGVYTITVIGFDASTGDRSLITERVVVK